jgi:hypothetical protein
LPLLDRQVDVGAVEPAADVDAALDRLAGQLVEGDDLLIGAHPSATGETPRHEGRAHGTDDGAPAP